MKYRVVFEMPGIFKGGSELFYGAGDLSWCLECAFWWQEAGVTLSILPEKKGIVAL